MGELLGRAVGEPIPPPLTPDETGYWPSLVVVSSEFDVPAGAFGLFPPRTGSS